MFIVVSSGSPGADGGAAAGGEAGAGGADEAVFALRVLSGPREPLHDQESRVIHMSASIEIRRPLVFGIAGTLNNSGGVLKPKRRRDVGSGMKVLE
jgi:hypothetical protein